MFKDKCRFLNINKQAQIQPMLTSLPLSLFADQAIYCPIVRIMMFYNSLRTREDAYIDFTNILQVIYRLRVPMFLHLRGKAK